MNNWKIVSVFLLCGLAGVWPARAQNFQEIRRAILQQQAETRSQIDDIESQINNFELRLDKTNQKYDALYSDYMKQKRLLALHRKKITKLRKERDQIANEIKVTRQKLDAQQKKLVTLITNYKTTLRYLYKNGQTSRLALILSSASLNQMLIRNYYLKKFETYRQKQADDIRRTRDDLKRSKAELDSAAIHNKNVLQKIEREKEKLAQKTHKQARNVKLLRQNRQQIKQKLAENRRQKQQLGNTLAQLVAREKKVRERHRRNEAAKSSTGSSSDNASSKSSAPSERPARRYIGEVGYLSDEKLKKVETSFAALRGKLPWPVESHTVSEHFGRHRNPIYGTVTPNLGIEIVTKADAQVHVVHDGYVFGVQPVTGYGNVVFVSHGKYQTAYGNLSRVLVRKNTILHKGDVVGYAGDQHSIRGKSVFFMLSVGTQNVNPEHWLK